MKGNWWGKWGHSSWSRSGNTNQNNIQTWNAGKKYTNTSTRTVKKKKEVGSEASHAIFVRLGRRERWRRESRQEDNKNKEENKTFRSLLMCVKIPDCTSWNKKSSEMKVSGTAVLMMIRPSFCMWEFLLLSLTKSRLQKEKVLRFSKIVNRIERERKILFYIQESFLLLSWSQSLPLSSCTLIFSFRTMMSLNDQSGEEESVDKEYKSHEMTVLFKKCNKTFCESFFPLL